jgi:hypothetical protein
LSLALGVAIPIPARAVDVIDHAQAQSIFRQAETICARDHGTLWRHPLCGPMLLVDPDSRSVVTNQADAAGVLQRSGSVFTGVLPPSEPLADAPISWSGTRWTELLWPWPIREDPDLRHVTLAHELFHRIQQDDLHLVVADGDNAQLDTLDGRYLIELEWKALAAALQALGARERRVAAADAILFRRERYRVYPGAAANESVLESNEGIAEYTGVKLGLKTRTERIHYAIRDLSTWSQAPSFVRSFAYATGPAYGLLLDQADSGWLKDFAKNQQDRRLDQRLSAALRIPEPDLTQVHARAVVYDSDGSLHAHEVAREKENRAQLVEFKKTLIDGPVLTLPLVNSQFEFKPGSIVALEDIGKVYPTITLHDDWGTLTVDSGGALVRKQPDEVSVSAVGFDMETLRGSGYTLALASGWIVQPATRAGDLVVRRAENASH